MAFCHDLFCPLPPDYDACGCLYAELPWPRGQAIYDSRAGVQATRQHEDLLERWHEIILARNCPIVIVGGRSFMGRLPRPQLARPVVQRGAKNTLGVVFGYRTEELPACPASRLTDDQLIEWLVRRYGSIGDPVCGYGQTGAIAYRLGKRFVLSDYNPYCIGWIAANAKHWTGPDQEAHGE